MSAQNSHEWLVDALYKERDESSQTSGESSSQELDAQQLEELGSYGELLGGIREALPMQELDGGVRENLLDAARKQAELNAARTPRTARRGPGAGPGATNQPLWSRGRFGAVTQIAVAVCVCIFAGVLFNAFSTQSEPTMMADSPAPGALAEREQAAPEEALAQKLDATKTPQNDFPDTVVEEQRKELALADPAADEKPSELDDADVDALDGKKVAIARSANRKAKRSRGASSYDYPAKKPASSKSKPAPAPKKEAKDTLGSVYMDKDGYSRSGAATNEKADVADNSWGLDSGDVAAEDAPTDQYASAPKDAGNIFGGSEGPARSTSSAPSKLADSLGNSVRSAQPSVAPPAEPIEAEEAAPAAKAASAPEQTQAAEREPNNSTLADAERSWGRNDYAQTVDDVDSYLSRGMGTNKERARALELKAQALKKLGRSSEATRVYQQLERDYPDYYRKEKIRTKKKRSKKAPARASEMSADDDLFGEGF